MDLKRQISTILELLNDNKGTVAIGFGTVGLATTTIWAVGDTPKALKILEEKEREKGGKLNKKEMIQASWKCYIRSFAIGTLSVGCIVAGCMENHRQQALLMTACSLSETALKEMREAAKESSTAFNEFREAVRESTDDETMEKIERKAAEKDIKRSTDIVNFSTKQSPNDQLFMDSLTGRYFWSTIDKMNAIESEIKLQMMHEDYVSVNTYFDYCGLSPVEGGDNFGWSLYETGEIVLYFAGEIAEDRQTPCIVVRHGCMPEPI